MHWYNLLLIFKHIKMEQNKEKTLPKGHYDSFVAQLSKDIQRAQEEISKKEGFEKVHQSVNPISQNYIG